MIEIFDIMFDLVVITSSLCSSITNIYIVGCLYQTGQYFFATSCLIFIVATQTIHIILFYPKAKYITKYYCKLRLLTLLIYPLVPFLYYLHIKQSLNNRQLNEKTPINNKTYNNVYIISWKESHQRTLKLFMIQSIFETI
eukprot:462153_1